MSTGNSKTYKYEVVASSYPATFQLTVEAYLNEGWELVGGVSHDNGTYYQAVKKEWVQT
jgi:hypothetical protein